MAGSWLKARLERLAIGEALWSLAEKIWANLPQAILAALGVRVMAAWEWAASQGWGLMVVLGVGLGYATLGLLAVGRRVLLPGWAGLSLPRRLRPPNPSQVEPDSAGTLEELSNGAFSRGLIDRLGALEEAIEAAKADRERVHQETLKAFASVGVRLRTMDERLDSSDKVRGCLNEKIDNLSRTKDNLSSRLDSIQSKIDSAKKDLSELIGLVLNRERDAKLKELKSYFARVETALLSLGQDATADAATRQEVANAASYISNDLVNLLGYDQDELRKKYLEIENQVVYEIRNGRLEESEHGWAYAERRFRLLGRLLEEQGSWIEHFERNSKIWLYGRAKA